VGYTLGWGFFACAASNPGFNTKPIEYTYEYKTGPQECGVSGNCSFTIYKNGKQIYDDLTLQRPLIQLEPGAAFIPINTTAHSTHYLKFILFQHEANCKTDLADCEILPYLYSNPRYN